MTSRLHHITVYLVVNKVLRKMLRLDITIRSCKFFVCRQCRRSVRRMSFSVSTVWTTLTLCAYMKAGDVTARLTAMTCLTSGDVRRIAAAVITLHVSVVMSVFTRRGSVTVTLTVMTAAMNTTVSWADCCHLRTTAVIVLCTTENFLF